MGKEGWNAASTYAFPWYVDKIKLSVTVKDIETGEPISFDDTEYFNLPKGNYTSHSDITKDIKYPDNADSYDDIDGYDDTDSYDDIDSYDLNSLDSYDDIYYEDDTNSGDDSEVKSDQVIEIPITRGYNIDDAIHTFTFTLFRQCYPHMMIIKNNTQTSLEVHTYTNTTIPLLYRTGYDGNNNETIYEDLTDNYNITYFIDGKKHYIRKNDIIINNSYENNNINNLSFKSNITLNADKLLIYPKGIKKYKEKLGAQYKFICHKESYNLTCNDTLNLIYDKEYDNITVNNMNFTFTQDNNSQDIFLNNINQYTYIPTIKPKKINKADNIDNYVNVNNTTFYGNSMTLNLDGSIKFIDITDNNSLTLTYYMGDDKDSTLKMNIPYIVRSEPLLTLSGFKFDNTQNAAYSFSLANASIKNVNTTYCANDFTLTNSEIEAYIVFAKEKDIVNNINNIEFNDYKYEISNNSINKVDNVKDLTDTYIMISYDGENDPDVYIEFNKGCTNNNWISSDDSNLLSDNSLSQNHLLGYRLAKDNNYSEAKFAYVGCGIPLDDIIATYYDSDNEVVAINYANSNYKLTYTSDIIKYSFESKWDDTTAHNILGNYSGQHNANKTINSGLTYNIAAAIYNTQYDTNTNIYYLWTDINYGISPNTPIILKTKNNSNPINKEFFNEIKEYVVNNCGSSHPWFFTDGDDNNIPLIFVKYQNADSFFEQYINNVITNNDTNIYLGCVISPDNTTDNVNNKYILKASEDNNTSCLNILTSLPNFDGTNFYNYLRRAYSADHNGITEAELNNVEERMKGMKDNDTNEYDNAVIKEEIDLVINWLLTKFCNYKTIYTDYKVEINNEDSIIDAIPNNYLTNSYNIKTDYCNGYNLMYVVDNNDAFKDLYNGLPSGFNIRYIINTTRDKYTSDNVYNYSSQIKHFTGIIKSDINDINVANKYLHLLVYYNNIFLDELTVTNNEIQSINKLSINAIGIVINENFATNENETNKLSINFTDITNYDKDIMIQQDYYGCIDFTYIIVNDNVIENNSFEDNIQHIHIEINEDDNNKEYIDNINIDLSMEKLYLFAYRIAIYENNENNEFNNLLICTDWKYYPYFVSENNRYNYILYNNSLDEIESSDNVINDFNSNKGTKYCNLYLFIHQRFHNNINSVSWWYVYNNDIENNKITFKTAKTFNYGAKDIAPGIFPELSDKYDNKQIKINRDTNSIILI